MKITLLTHTLHNGGAERVGVCWANGLNKLGHDVTIYTRCGRIDYEPDEGVKIRYFNPNKKNKILKLLDNISITYKLYRHIKEDKPDVIIDVMPAFSLNLLAAKGISMRNVPLIMTEHNSFERPDKYPMSKSMKFNKWKLNKYFDYITVLTNADKRVIGNKLKNVEVLHNPLFLKPLNEIPPKKNIILAVGRLDVWECKGFDNLINAWNKIYKNHGDWILRIVGAGSKENREYIYQLSKDNPQIEFKDFTYDIVEEYREVSVFCLSSRYEGWGLVLVEALSQGCACVACDFRGRQAEIINEGENGLLCDPDNADMLSQKLDLILSDERLRDRLQRNAILNLERFSQERVAKKLEDICIRVSNHKC